MSLVKVPSIPSSPSRRENGEFFFPKSLSSTLLIYRGARAAVLRYEEEIERPSKRHCSEQAIAEVSWEDRTQEMVRYHELQPPLPPVQYISAHNAHHSHATTQMGHSHVSAPYAQYHRYVANIETWPNYM